MPTKTKIAYNSSLSIKQNAEKNGVSESGMRYYIKSRKIDRRHEVAISIIEDIQKYIKKHPGASKAEIVRETKHGIHTLNKYWEFIHGKEIVQISENKNSTKTLRELNNFYATHPSCTHDIIREEYFCHEILEPFCGCGTMSEVIKGYGHSVLSYDLIDRGYGNVGDFFEVDYRKGVYDIISNPPYDENLSAIIERCLSICRNKVALIMPLRYLSGKERYEKIYRKFPPIRVYVYIERIRIAKNADFKTYNDVGSNPEIYAWFVWEKGYVGTTELRWMRNDKSKK